MLLGSGPVAHATSLLQREKEGEGINGVRGWVEGVGGKVL